MPHNLIPVRFPQHHYNRNTNATEERSYFKPCFTQSLSLGSIVEAATRRLAMAHAPLIPLSHDWRDKESYAYTESLPAQAWAWEFLRRNPEYHLAWSEHAEEPPGAKVSSSGVVLMPQLLDDEARRWGLASFRGALRRRAGGRCLLVCWVLPIRSVCTCIARGRPAGARKLLPVRADLPDRRAGRAGWSGLFAFSRRAALAAANGVRRRSPREGVRADVPDR